MQSLRNFVKSMLSGSIIRPTVVKHENGKVRARDPSTVIPHVAGKIHFHTAAKYGQLTTRSARSMDKILRELLEPPPNNSLPQSISGPMSLLDTHQSTHGIDSIKWEILQSAFDKCPALCRSTEAHQEGDFRLSAGEQFANSRARARDGAMVREDVMARLRNFVHDNDVFVNTSPGLQDFMGLLVNPLPNASDTEASSDGGVKPREYTFTDINVLRYVNLGRPYIKISRLFLVVSTEFKHMHKPPVDWNISGGTYKPTNVRSHLSHDLNTEYNSSTYLLRPEWLERHCRDVREQGQQEMQNVIPRKNSRLS